MAMRDTAEQISSTRSVLPNEMADRFKAAGILYAEQNRYFQKVEFSFQGDVTVMFTTDHMADVLNKMFNDRLCKVFGYKWKIVGTAGNRGTLKPDNPEYGPASRGARFAENDLPSLRKALADLEEQIAGMPEHSDMTVLARRMAGNIRGRIEAEEQRISEAEPDPRYAS